MSSRRRIRVALLSTILAALVLPATPVLAADTDPDLTVRILSLTPSRLSDGDTVTLTGTVTNEDDHAWDAVQAYLVIPASPFTTRAQIDEAIDNRAAYTGTRVVDEGSFDDMGDVAPGESVPFRVKVPYSSLAVSGAEGVYPVGVQILGTDEDGARSTDAIGRATTFLPLVSSKQDPVPASVLWPFLMPDHRGADGDYADPGALLAAVRAGGRLRNLLDLASSTTGRAATVLVDPALLVGVDDLANRRNVPESFEITAGQRADAAAFVQDLLAFARAESCWVLGFDRPDDLALSQNPDLRRGLDAAVDDATDSTLARFQLSGRKVSWPTDDGVTSGLLRDLRGAGDSPVIVASESLSGWERRDGSVVQHDTERGPMPLLVNDVLDDGVPGQTSVVTLRQRILSDAALAVLQRGIDPGSKADAVTMVDPRWNPGSQWRDGRLSEAFDSPFTDGRSLDDLLTRRLSTDTGVVPATAKAKPVDRAQLLAAADILSLSKELSSVIPDSAVVDEARSRDVAGVLGVRWRTNRSTGMAVAAARVRDAVAALDELTIEGPPSVTLSSSEGRFPITITNGTQQTIRVGVALDSSNPALTIPPVKPIDVSAGERQTLTVEIDLGRQSATTLTARLISPEGKTIGQPSKDFNVRSSNVGTTLWVAMALAALFVLVALARRFRHRRTQMTSVRAVGDDG